MTFLGMLLIMQMISAMYAQMAPQEQITVRGGPNIYFQLQKRHVALSQELWLLHVKVDLFDHQDNINKLVAAAAQLKIDIADYNAWQKLIMKSENSPQGFGQHLLFVRENELLINELTFINSKIEQLQRKYNELIDVFYNLDDKQKEQYHEIYDNRINPGLRKPKVPNFPRRPTRKKRFVGLMGMALGIYSFASISALKSQVKLLMDRSNELSSNQARINLWLQQSTRLTKENSESIATLKDHMNDLTKQIEQEMLRQAKQLKDYRHQGHLRSILRSSISLLTMVEQDLFDTFQDLSQQLFSALHGKFPLHLLNLDNLTATMESINRDLPSDKQIALTTKDLRNVYQLPALVFTSGKKLFITLTFPVIRSKADHYDIYSLHMTPLKMSNGMIGTYVVDPKTAGLAVNEQKNTFKELNRQELEACTIPHVLSCAHISFEHKDYRSRNCLFAYYTKEPEKYLEYCIIIPMQDPPPFLIHELYQNEYMIYSEQHRVLQAECTGIHTAPDVTLTEGTHFLSIPQICSLQDSQLILYGVESYQSSIRYNNSLNSQINRYLSYIKPLNITQVETPLTGIDLPKIALKDTTQMNKYLGQLAQQITPYFPPLKQPTDYAFWIMVAIAIAVAVTIGALVILYLCYYKKHKLAFEWANHAAQTIDMQKLLELLPLTNTTLKSNVAPAKTKSPKKRASVRMREIDEKLSDTLNILQKQNIIQPTKEKSMYPNILSKMTPTPPTIQTMTYDLPPPLQSSAPNAMAGQSIGTLPPSYHINQILPSDKL